MKWRKDHPEIKNDSDMHKFGNDEGWLKGPTLFATCNLSPTGAQVSFLRQEWHVPR